MIDIVKDMSTLTTIPEKTLHKFYKKTVYCICEAVREDLLDESVAISELDIGIGTLYIKHDTPGNIKYHFEPNDFLEKSMTQTVVNKENLLEDVLNDALAKKFMELYKDLC